MRDKDSSDCLIVKQALKQKSEEAGKRDTLIRIACREIESWYLGDIDSIEKVYPRTRAIGRRTSTKYQNPDSINSPVQEIARITDRRYQKINGSREFGPVISIESNRSHSFGVFVSGIRGLVSGWEEA